MNTKLFLSIFLLLILVVPSVNADEWGIEVEVISLNPDNNGEWGIEVNVTGLTTLDNGMWGIEINVTGLNSLDNGLWGIEVNVTRPLTIVNQSPIISNPNITNNEIGVSIYKGEFSCLINDTEGDTFNWTIECSNGNSSSANNASNGTKKLTLSTLSFSTEYKIYINATDSYGGVTEEVITFTTSSNTLPTITAESIPEGSTDVAIDTSSWYCTITESDLNQTVNWTIEMVNYSNSANEDSNGVKTLTFLANLSYSTTYTVYINTTDGIGWYNETHNFTTVDNSHPTITNENPACGSSNLPVNISSWSCLIEDVEHDFDWTIEMANYSNSGTGDSNGTKVITFLANLSYSTTYTIYTNVTDGFDWTNETCSITTRANSLPTITEENPACDSDGILVDLSNWTCTINDSDRHLMSWSIECNGVSNSSTDYNSSIRLDFTSLFLFGTNYTVYINVTDGFDWYNETCDFETERYEFTIINFYLDYFTWYGENVSAYEVASYISGFDDVNESIAIWNLSAWDNDNWLWEKYYGDGSGSNWTIHFGDVVQVNLTDTGTQTLNLPISDSNFYSSARTITKNSINNGYNYTGYPYNCNGRKISNISAEIGLSFGEVVSWWDNDNQEWKAWIQGISQSSYDITIDTRWTIFETKVINTHGWLIE